MTQAAFRLPDRLGGDISLDFTNTVEFRDSERCLEFLHSYAHVLAWCQRNDQVSDTEAERLLAIAARQPAKAADAYRAALDLRDTLYHIFTSVIADETPAPNDLARLNAALIAAQRRVEPTEGGFAWAWAQTDDLAHILAPVALAAAHLLTSDHLRQVRQCPNCGWLFVDTSRNHSRRWCSMEICGSQVKSRLQYQRRKTSNG